MSDRRLKILVCSHDFGISGAQKCLNLLVEELRTRFDIFATVPAEGPALQFFRCRNIPVSIAPVVWAAAPSFDAIDQHGRFAENLGDRVARFVDIVRLNSIDLVITNTSVVLEAAIAASICHKPHIFHVLEVLGLDPDLRSALNFDSYKLFLSDCSDSFVTVSQIVSKSLRPFVDPARDFRIPTGIPVPTGQIAPVHFKSIFPSGTGSPIFLYLGLLSRRKGVLSLASAIVASNQSYPQARFAIAGGDGGVRSEFERIVASEVESGRVAILGKRSDPLNLISSCDVVVMPSLLDPLPVSVLEAMAMAKPIIATRSGGCEDLVCHMSNGILVSPEDPTQLLGAIGYFCDHRSLLEDFGRRSKDRVSRFFSPAGHAEAFAKCIESTYEGFRPSPIRSARVDLFLRLIEASRSSSRFPLYRRARNTLVKVWRRIRR